MEMSETRSVKVDDREYLVGSLDCFEQFHIARRLGPMLLTFFGSVQNTPSAENLMEAASVDLINHLSAMKEDDLNYVLKTALSKVRVREANGASSIIFDAHLGALRYHNLKMHQMLQLVVAVVKENMESFFPSGQPASKAE